jgi:hypothetical protein
MNQSEKPEKRLVKKTVIPIKIEDNPKELRGIVRFSTEAYNASINPACNIERKKNIVYYKNQNVKNEE